MTTTDTTLNLSEPVIDLTCDDDSPDLEITNVADCSGIEFIGITSNTESSINNNNSSSSSNNNNSSSSSASSSGNNTIQSILTSYNPESNVKKVLNIDTNSKAKKKNSKSKGVMLEDDLELPDLDEFKNLTQSVYEQQSRPAILCGICQENEFNFKARKTQIVSTHCGHIFCQPCIDESLKRYKCCPVCRKSMPSKTTSYHNIYL